MLGCAHTLSGTYVHDRPLPAASFACSCARRGVEAAKGSGVCVCVWSSKYSCGAVNAGGCAQRAGLNQGAGLRGDGRGIGLRRWWCMSCMPACAAVFLVDGQEGQEEEEKSGGVMDLFFLAGQLGTQSASAGPWPSPHPQANTYTCPQLSVASSPH